MSSILWDGDNLIQKVGDNVAELARHVKHDENSNEVVLWLKDTRGVFGNNKGYIRGESFPSMKDAKRLATSSTSAFHFHHMWMAGLRGGDPPPPYEPTPPTLKNIRERLASGAAPQFPQFGDLVEAKSRASLRSEIAQLRGLMKREASVPGGIGHNRPPEPLTLPIELSVEVDQTIEEIDAEVAAAAPNVESRGGGVNE